MKKNSKQQQTKSQQTKQQPAASRQHTKQPPKPQPPAGKPQTPFEQQLETERKHMQQSSEIGAVAGVDIGDKRSYVRLVGLDGELLEEVKLATNRAAIEKYFRSWPRLRVVLETGGHTNWMRRLIAGLGHEVLVADARQLRLISQSHAKNDRNDAYWLAELGRTNTDLLAPVAARDEHVEQHRSWLREREAARRWSKPAPNWKNVYKRQPTAREAIEGIEPETQFGRMCAKLGIRIIVAASQGRVERHHGTHQDRMIKKMRLKGIADTRRRTAISTSIIWGNTMPNFGALRHDAVGRDGAGMSGRAANDSRSHGADHCGAEQRDQRVGPAP